MDTLQYAKNINLIFKLVARNLPMADDERKQLVEFLPLWAPGMQIDNELYFKYPSGKNGENELWMGLRNTKAVATKPPPSDTQNYKKV